LLALPLPLTSSKAQAIQPNYEGSQCTLPTRDLTGSYLRKCCQQQQQQQQQQQLEREQEQQQGCHESHVSFRFGQDDNKL